MAEEIRNIGYLAWKDPLAWMESMRGKRWENLIRQEKHNYHTLSSQRGVAHDAKEMEKEMADASQYTFVPSISIGCGNVDAILFSGSNCRWKWKWEKKYEFAFDLDTSGPYVWYSTNAGDNTYAYEHICVDNTGKICWRKQQVTPQMAVIGNLYYYIRLIETFRTIELRVCNALTGKGDRILYREENPERDIYLWKANNRTLYFKSSDPQTDDLYRIDGMNLIPLYKKSVMQMPLGLSAEGDDCVLIRNSHMEPWKAMGRPVSAWNFPKEEIRWANLFSGHVMTIHEGEQCIWHCAEKKRPILLCKLKVGSIEPNNWSTWENMLVESFVVNSPNSTPYLFHIMNHKLYRVPPTMKIRRPVRFKPLEVHRFHTTSKDGTKVPYVIVHQKGVKPKAQFIIVYGAYGTITPVDWPYEIWYPLLSRKWAMVYAMVRGGGDMDEKWSEVARRDNRHVVVDDFEAIIRNSQRKLDLGPDKTVIYGRSAGGLPIGAIVSRFPNGTLVGAAFTEVPYVDVLRTSSNPKLPLTVGEFKEFGNPKERILNFKELLSVSPIDTLPPGGAPGVFVLSRVGLLDKQVFAYESFKWIQRLRGETTPDESHPSQPRGKYVTIERNEAHQYSYEAFTRCRTRDLAIMNAWVDGTLRYE
jgi:hypothetical protein